MLATEGNSYDDRKRDLRSYFAQFGRRPLNDSAIWSLSLADSTLPEGHIGFKAWITWLAEVDLFYTDLREWGIGVGAQVARMKPRLGRRACQYVPSYKPEWGETASMDGLKIALGGELFGVVPGLQARAEQFGVRWQAYRRIRDFVAGSMAGQMNEYEDALVWATRANSRY